MTLKELFSYITLFIFGLLISYIRGFSGLLEFILFIIFYLLLFFSIYYLWKKLRKKYIMSFIDFIKYFFYRLSLFLIFITLFFTSVTYLINEKYSAKMPEYVITDGKKIVTFQTMSHIGTQNFYNQIISNIKNHKKNGGVLFFEGVKPGTIENGKKFNKAMGIQFDKDLYKNFSKLYGVVNQNNNDFLGHINDLDFNIDLTIDEIVKIYDNKVNTYSGNLVKNSLPPIDINKSISELLLSLNEKELKILVYINQAILNLILGSSSTQEFLTNNFSNKLLFEVILNKRDIVLSEAIINSEYNDIYVTYGLLHFKGVLELLKKDNPNWKIIKITNLYPLK